MLTGSKGLFLIITLLFDMVQSALGLSIVNLQLVFFSEEKYGALRFQDHQRGTQLKRVCNQKFIRFLRATDTKPDLNLGVELGHRAPGGVFTHFCAFRFLSGHATEVWLLIYTNSLGKTNLSKFG